MAIGNSPDLVLRDLLAFESYSWWKWPLDTLPHLSSCPTSVNTGAGPCMISWGKGREFKRRWWVRESNNNGPVSDRRDSHFLEGRSSIVLWLRTWFYPFTSSGTLRRPLTCLALCLGELTRRDQGSFSFASYCLFTVSVGRSLSWFWWKLQVSSTIFLLTTLFLKSYDF